MAQRVTNAEFEDKVIHFTGLAIVDFYSDSCVPCKKMSPVLSALETKYGSDIFVAKVNIAYEKELVEKFQVMSTPTFLFFRDGEVIERFSGAKKKEELEQIIEANK